MFTQDTIGYQQHDHGAIHDIAMLIHREHTISITVESGAEIGPNLEYLFSQRFKVFWFNRTGRMVREGAIQFKEEWDELGRQVLKHTRHDHAGHTVAGVDHDLDWSNFSHIDVGKCTPYIITRGL